LIHDRDLLETLGEGGLLSCEAVLEANVELLHLFKDQLDVGVRGIELVLLPSRVVDGFQNVAGLRSSDTTC
jgi:hypothetical protein